MENQKEDTINITYNVNEIISTAEINQIFTNSLQNPVTAFLSFPVLENINLQKFLVETPDTKIYSKVFPEKKEVEMEKKMDKEISSDSYITFHELFRRDGSEIYYTINIGTISPGQKIKLTTTYVQKINTKDLSYEFNIIENYPAFHYRQIDEEDKFLDTDDPSNKIIKSDFIIKAESKLTRLISPFMNESQNNNSTCKIKFSNENKQVNVHYTKNPSKDEKKEKNSNTILFRTEKISNPLLYYQYNPELKETVYSLNYISPSKLLKPIPESNEIDQNNSVSYYLKYLDKELIKETSALFIFLIDESANDELYKLERDTLFSFIKLLPPKSLFQEIAFNEYGSMAFFDDPVENNEENINQIIETLSDDSMRNYGKWKLDAAFSDIFTKSIENIKLKKNVILLNCGKGHEDDKLTIKLIYDRIKSNSDKFSFHSIGFGNGFDKSFLEKIGEISYGSSNFIKDEKDYEKNINNIMNDILNKCLRPNLSDIKFKLLNYIEGDGKIIADYCNNAVYKDDVINYSFIVDEKNKIDMDNLKDAINIELEAQAAADEIKEKISISKENVIKLEDGNDLSKIIIDNAIKSEKLEQGEDVDYFEKYQILSKDRYIFAEKIKNGQNSQPDFVKFILVDNSRRSNASRAAPPIKRGPPKK